MILNGHQIEPEKLYTPKEWASVRGVTEKTLAKNRSQRTGEPFIKVGRAVYYRGSDIIRHFEDRLERTGREAALRHAAELAQRRAGELTIGERAAEPAKTTKRTEIEFSAS